MGSGRLAVKINGRVVILKVVEIDWAEAAGVYVELHTCKRVRSTVRRCVQVGHAIASVC